MGFAERAVDACVKAMRSGQVSERQVRDVLKSRASGEAFVEFLGSQDVVVRRLASRIVSEKGPVQELVKAAMEEKDEGLLLDMLQMLGRKGAGVEALECLLSSDDQMTRDAAVEMFRRAGKPEYLFPLVFSEDDATSQRIKRYLNEKGKS